MRKAMENIVTLQVLMVGLERASAAKWQIDAAKQIKRRPPRRLRKCGQKREPAAHRLQHPLCLSQTGQNV